MSNEGITNSRLEQTEKLPEDGQKWRKGKTSRRREDAKMIENAMIGLRYEYSYA